MCCLVTDGGGALILTTADRAKDFPTKPVYLRGMGGESCEGQMVSQMEDFTSSKAFRISGRQAFESAGITHADVDHLMIYDAFAHLPVYGLEDLGFVPKGEGGAFIAEGHTKPGGKLPLNTNGGAMTTAAACPGHGVFRKQKEGPDRWLTRNCRRARWRGCACWT